MVMVCCCGTKAVWLELRLEEKSGVFPSSHKTSRSRHILIKQGAALRISKNISNRFSTYGSAFQFPYCILEQDWQCLRPEQ